jgi:hypothetical protein
MASALSMVPRLRMDSAFRKLGLSVSSWKARSMALCT